MEEKNIEQFNPTVAELTALVEATKNIKATDLTDKKQLEVVKESRKKLSDARINITKRGKELRQSAIDFQKAVIEKEKELISIISPEEDRLKEIEAEAKEIKIREERMAVLPQWKEKLSTIGDKEEISDEQLLGMDHAQFTDYYNQRVANKNDADRRAIEDEKKKNEEEAKRLEWEKGAQEREEKARKEEKERIEREAKEKAEREAKEKIESRIKELTSMGLTYYPSINSYILQDFTFPMLDIQTYDDDKWARTIVGAKNEMHARKVKADADAEQARIEADKKYQDFLTAHGYNEQTKDKFHIEKSGNVVRIYMLTGELNLE